MRESFTSEAFVGRTQTRYATLSKTAQSAQKAPGRSPGEQAPGPCFFLLAQTPNSLPSRPERQLCGLCGLERGRCDVRQQQMSYSAETQIGDRTTRPTINARCRIASGSTHPARRKIPVGRRGSCHLCHLARVKSGERTPPRSRARSKQDCQDTRAGQQGVAA